MWPYPLWKESQLSGDDKEINFWSPTYFCSSLWAKEETYANIVGLSRDCLQLASCPPDPTYKRGSGGIWLIPRASVMLITFWRAISLCQSHCR